MSFLPKFKYFFVFLSFAFAFFSCDKYVVYEKNIKIKNHNWKSNDTITFTTNVVDTSMNYDILINIRNGGTYEFSNLFVFITVTAPNGNHLTNTLEITLADKTGKWYGKGLGDIKSLSAVYKQNVKFSIPGIYTFKIVQGMRSKELPKIFDVGLRIQKSKKE